MIAQFEEYVDDTLDETLAYQLLTQAKNKAEMRLKPSFLHDVDSTQTASPGDTYLSYKTLNTNARTMLNLVVGNTRYYPVPFINREQWKNAARRYYIDWKNRRFALTGNNQAACTIHQFFLSSTPDITVADADSATAVLWPSEFHPLIPFEMAEIFQANIDPDEISFRMSKEQRFQKQEIEDMMIALDTDNKLAAMNYQGGFADDVEGNWPIDSDQQNGIPDLGTM